MVAMSNTISMWDAHAYISRETMPTWPAWQKRETLHPSLRLCKNATFQLTDSGNTLSESCCCARATTALKLCSALGQLDMHHEIGCIGQTWVA
jgi:hypothetical protein